MEPIQLVFISNGQFNDTMSFNLSVSHDDTYEGFLLQTGALKQSKEVRHAGHGHCPLLRTGSEDLARLAKHDADRGIPALQRGISRRQIRFW